METTRVHQGFFAVVLALASALSGGIARDFDDKDLGSDNGEPCCADSPDDDVSDVESFTDGHTTVNVYTRAGTFDIAFDGFIYMESATSAIETGTVTVFRADTVFRAASEISGPRVVTSEETSECIEIRIEHPESPLGRMTTILTLLREQGGLAARMEFVSGGVSDLVGLVPIHVGAGSGDLWEIDITPASTGPTAVTLTFGD